MADVDQDRLYATTDARVWAEEFAKVCPDVDQGLMIGWFANAIETGRAHAKVGLPDDAADIGNYIDNVAELELLRGTLAGPWLDDLHRAAAILRGEA